MRPRDYGNKLRSRSGKGKPKAKRGAPAGDSRKAAPPRDGAKTAAPSRARRRQDAPSSEAPRRGAFSRPGPRDNAPTRTSPRQQAPPREGPRGDARGDSAPARFSPRQSTPARGSFRNAPSPEPPSRDAAPRKFPPRRDGQRPPEPSREAPRKSASTRDASPIAAPRREGPPVLTSTSAKKTLDRVLSKAGLGSRTDAEEWIKDGRVKVNGHVAQSIEMWIDPKRDKVTLDGAPVLEGPKLYILLYKPKGYITTYKDPEGRPTVYQLLKGVPGFVGTAGRLDMDTSGLLILTNDTAFADFVTSPTSHVPKTYLVKSSTRLTDEQLDALRAGPLLDDGPTRPATVTRLRDSEKYTHFEITISEGRNRQVRRMVEAIGSKVLKLVRVRIGGLSIDGLQIGAWRKLTNNEVKQLIGAPQ